MIILNGLVFIIISTKYIIVNMIIIFLLEGHDIEISQTILATNIDVYVRLHLLC